MATLWTLYTVFLKIGTFAFGGGYAVLPLIEEYVIEQHGWLTAKEMTDLISLSQMTPGPIAINSATFIGTRVAGIPGAVVATMGNVTPQFFLMLFMGYLLFGGRRLKFLDRILLALKPAIVGLIAIAAISMIQASLFLDGSWSLRQWSILGIIGFLIGLVLYKKKWSVIQIVAISAAAGLLIQAAMLLIRQ